ncbi:hypothetical protein HC031_12605 [Planosporangium thailandense]|uniref:S-adenosyl methyltransferase n=1 Tax=Planosporangium thailandense TaxID=765197 RepID=A0ABX0XWY3_9ACTN|nr:hypothetical protein [Planosporangium thailandense]
MDRPTWAPTGVDILRPASSRMYDYMLGGSHNFQVDREVADQAIAHMPELPFVLREGRSFLRRAVRFLVEAGVDQFLDLGSGIPTVGNVHEVARQVNPAARVVYVDNDPIAVAHSRAILGADPRAIALEADLRHPLQILNNPQVRGLLDVTRPVAVLLVAVLHFVPDSDQPTQIVRQLRDAVAPGSYLVVAHSTDDGAAPAGQASARGVYARSGNAVIARSQQQVAEFFDGWELVPPGVVRVPLWHATDDAPVEAVPADADRFPGYVGVARLP